MTLRSHLQRLSSEALPWVALAAFLVAGSQAHALSRYDVHVDTSAFSGIVGNVAFDLIDGDGASANNSVTATAFSTDGTLADGSDVVLQDVSFFNEQLKEVTFGSYFDFTLELSENNTPPGFDQFSFFVLDSVFQILVESDDPTGANALFAVDIDGSSGGALSNFSSLTADFSWSITRIPSTSVPELGMTALPLLLALVLLNTKRGTQTDRG